ncbi:MAG: 2-polyprenyl-3-methyl-5-hydroxy-6-metoxy-1,4-benzoquinol methylase [Thermoproteota archaeon]|jgi:2-polyprenyl-3-methyl-5-hydroxy-6-metoxy-1,4-benzoquinol methylase
MDIQQSFKKLQNPSHYKFEFIKCYQCGSEETEYLLTGEEDLTGKEGQFQYVTCKDCGLAYQNPRIHVDQIKEFYDSEYIAHRKKKDWGMLTPLYERAMNKHDRDKEKLVKKFAKLDKDTKVLDIGCAVGTFLLHLRNKNKCQIAGVDFKEDLTYPDFDKIDFHCGLFYEQENLKENEYDVVTMWHFLEHCYNPPKSLQKAAKVVKPGGKVIIEVPRLDSFSYTLFKDKWPGVQAPQHTVMFDKENFIKMIEKNGLRVVKYLPYGAFPSYFYLFAGTYFKTIGKGLNLEKIVAPYFAGQFLLSPLLLLENKLNLAMQTIICEKV